MKLKTGAWSFGGQIPNKFEKHISKSVPLYVEGHNIIGKLSDYFLTEKSVCYDIGCSTANLLSKIYDHTNKKNVEFIGIEIEKKMFQHAKKNIQKRKIKILNSDIRKIKLKKNNLVISYYTLQFISPNYRQQIINKIFKSLNWGGAFIFLKKLEETMLDSRIYYHLYTWILKKIINYLQKILFQSQNH